MKKIHYILIFCGIVFVSLYAGVTTGVILCKSSGRNSTPFSVQNSDAGGTLVSIQEGSSGDGNITVFNRSYQTSVGLNGVPEGGTVSLYTNGVLFTRIAAMGTNQFNGPVIVGSGSGGSVMTAIISTNFYMNAIAVPGNGDFTTNIAWPQCQTNATYSSNFTVHSDVGVFKNVFCLTNGTITVDYDKDIAGNITLSNHVVYIRGILNP